MCCGREKTGLSDHVGMELCYIESGLGHPVYVHGNNFNNNFRAIFEMVYTGVI